MANMVTLIPTIRTQWHHITQDQMEKTQEAVWVLTNAPAPNVSQLNHHHVRMDFNSLMVTLRGHHQAITLIHNLGLTKEHP